MKSGDARRLAGLAVRASGAAARHFAGATSRLLKHKEGLIPILMYHRVHPDGASTEGLEPGMFVRASTFERHVRWLRQRFELVTLSEAVDAARGRDRGRVAVLTFDDGWRDNLTHAWPVLQRHGARATIFLVTDWVRGRSAPGEAFLSPEEVRFLAGNRIELGAHTASHPKLDQISAERIEFEMQASKAAVSSWTGSRCRTFAYPFGRFGEVAVEAAGRHFDASVVVGGGWWPGGEPMARVPRISVHDDVARWVPMFEARLAGIY